MDVVSVIKLGFNGLVELFYPCRCLSCGLKVAENGLCDECRNNLSLTDGTICTKCGYPTEVEVDDCRQCKRIKIWFTAARSIGLYEDPLKEAVHSLKYGDGRRGSEFLGKLMSEKVSEFESPIDAITYIPMHKRKLSDRGYNQAELLAKQISNELNMPVLNSLVKVKTTPDQNTLELKDRKNNLSGAFRLRQNIDVKDKNILLIDDVYTSGTTINEASRILIKAKAANVFGLTVARTTRK